MQSYGVFEPIPRYFVVFTSGCYDTHGISETPVRTPVVFVAKGHKKGRKGIMSDTFLPSSFESNLPDFAIL